MISYWNILSYILSYSIMLSYFFKSVFSEDMDFQLQAGQTPLHVWAAFSGDAAVAHALLQHNGEVDEWDNDGITPLMLSCQTGNERSCRTYEYHDNFIIFTCFYEY